MNLRNVVKIWWRFSDFSIDSVPETDCLSCLSVEIDKYLLDGFMDKGIMGIKVLNGAACFPSQIRIKGYKDTRGASRF